MSSSLTLPVRCAEKRARLVTRPALNLEAEASLEVDNSRAQPRRRLAEVGIGNVGRDGGRRDIQEIEHIQQIGFDFDPRILSEPAYPRQSERLGDVKIGISIPRTGK